MDSGSLDMTPATVNYSAFPQTCLRKRMIGRDIIHMDIFPLKSQRPHDASIRFYIGGLGCGGSQNEEFPCFRWPRFGNKA